MEFDKSRVYTAVNADELKVGSKCIFANTVQDLKAFVKTKRPVTLTSIGDESSPKRFMGSYGYADVAYLFAYLIEPPSKPKYRPFESVEKAMEAIKAHGRYVIKTNNMMSAFLVTEDDKDQGESRIFIDGYWYSLQELCRLFVFADDDTPCGELVEG